MKTIALLAAAALALSGSAFAAPLYSENFDVDPTASWTVNDSGLSDIEANFFYDYSAIGVPAAPNGTGTRGLKMTANNSGGVFSGFSVSPTGQSFSGDYKVTFDIWLNYVGPLGVGGSGTTQLAQMGIGTAGNVAMWPGAGTKESLTFATTLDGGSSVDYRVYSSLQTTGYPEGDPIFASGGGRNNSNPYYTAAFPSVSAPAAQLALFPGQTGSTDAGEASFAWRTGEINVVNNIATWSLDGTLLATVDLTTVTLGGGNILFGHSDTNAGSSTDPNDSLLNVTLIDNIVVTPEPATLGLLALGGLVLRRRR